MNSSDDCARAELLIAAGASSPLCVADEEFLPGHLSRCPACREAALEPPTGEDLGLPTLAPANYVLGAEIGRGGMGRVLAARDRRIGRAVALKEMLTTAPMARARFEREARITARLQHPGIVSIYEVGRWPDGRPFFAMPIFPGRTLREAIQAGPGATERLHLIPSVIAAADAVAYAHSRRIIHRDLTPSNILLGAFGETIVIDWGVAKDLDGDDDDHGVELDTAVGSRLTVDGAVVGTPAFIAPEQAAGRPVDERADVYALGAILYQVLSGRPPYDGLAAAAVIGQLRARRSPRPIADRSIPRELISVARRAMDFDAWRRYPTAADLAEDLRRYQNGQPVRAHAYSRRERAGRWLSRRVALVVTTSLMVLVVAAVAVVLGASITGERNRAEETATVLLQEEGRQELLAGRPARALAYLNSAYSRGDRSAALRFLLRAAARSMEAFKPLFQGPVYPTDVALSDDGRRLAVANGESVSVWSTGSDGPQRAARRPLAVFRDGTDLSRVAFSRDGARLLTWAWPAAPSGRPVRAVGRAAIWDVAKGVALQTFAPAGRVTDARWNRDESLLLTGGETDRAAGVWDARTGTPLPTFPGPPTGQPLVARWIGDGTSLLTFDGQGMAVVREARTGSVVRSIDTQVKAAVLFDASADGARFVTIAPGGSPALWDATTAAPIAQLPGAPPFAGMSFSPKGDRFFTVDMNRRVRLFGAEGGALVADLGGALAVRWNGDGSRLATTHGDQILRLWLPHDGALIDVHEGPDVADAGGGYLMRLALSADGSRLATASQMGFVSVCELGRSSLVLSVPGSVPLTVAGFRAASPDLVTIDRAGTLHAWNARTGAPGRAAEGRVLSLSGDSTRALVALDGDRNRVWLRDTSAGTQLLEVDARAPVTSAGLSPDGSRLLTVTEGEEVTLWDARAGRRLGALTTGDRHASAIDVFAFSPDGKRLVIRHSGAETSELWDGDNGRRIAAIQTGSGAYPFFSPDGTRLATSGLLLQMRQASDGQLLYQGPAGSYRSQISFSRDSAYLALISITGTVSVLDVHSGRRLANFDSSATQAMFAPDSALLATVGGGCTTMWDWRAGRMLARFGVAAEVSESSMHHLDIPSRPLPPLAQFAPSLGLLAVAQPGGGVLVWDASLETRSPRELALIPPRHLVPWKLSKVEGGRLVPAVDHQVRQAWRGAEKPQNLQLEEGTLGALPAGWTSPKIGYRAVLTDDHPHGGRRCALLEGTPWGTSFGHLIEWKRDGRPRGTMLGYLLQSIDATPYRGKKVILRAAARNGGPGGMEGRPPGSMRRVPGVFLWLRTDLTSDEIGFFDSVLDQVIAAPEWQDYQIVTEVERDARVLTFGLGMFGEGRAWLDDVRIEIVGS
jgi:eukaryotic-like serine/threonine-protein kinase